MNLKVQQLAKEQQQCHKEVSRQLMGRGSAGRGDPGAGPDPGWRHPALLCSCSRPTVSSAGGSPSTTSVSRDTWARPSSRCRCGFCQPWVPGVCLPFLNMGCPLQQWPPGVGVRQPLLGCLGLWVRRGYSLALSRVWTPPPGHQRRRGPSGQATAGGPEGRGVAGHGQAGAAGADPGGWAGLGLGAGGGVAGADRGALGPLVGPTLTSL